MTSKSPSFATATPSLSPLSILIGGSSSESYKSIDELVWDDIPPFAVLTGLNGSGKTQLLELLAHKLTNAWHPQLEDLSRVLLSVSGDSFSPDEVTYIPNQWRVSNRSLDIAHMQSAKKQLFQQFKESNTNNRRIERRAKRAFLERLVGSPLQKIDVEAFCKQLPDDYSFMLEEGDVTAGLCYVFLAYRVKFLEEIERGTKVTDVPSIIGPAPWDVVNQIFATAEFPYRVVSPLNSSLLEAYQLQLEDSRTNVKLHPNDLSSGEVILLSLVLWLYNSQHHGRFPRLLLLDEPDAHLHPSMTRHFMNVLNEVLVEQYGVRVILSTHSPSTVALAPEGSVFEMSRSKPRIKASKSKAHTIGLLTAGLVIVSEGTRYVLVEDSNDVAFYSAIWEILSDYGPSKDPRSLKPSPSIVFLPASSGAGRNKISGGQTVVSQWVEKLDQAPLSEIIRGITDRDSGNVPTSRVCVLSRYSIENYLLDPFVVFGVLLDQGTAPLIQGVNISQGDEHRLRELSSAELQSILDAVRSHVEPTISSLTAADSIPQTVTFTRGQRVNYPKWMIDHRGHDLLPMYQTAFGGPGVISPPRLDRSFRRVRLIPIELADIMDSLQN